MDNNVEKWGIHPETGYEVSSFGRVKSRMYPDKFLKPSICQGYYQVSFKIGMKRIHRLVWETFKSKIPPGLIINHIDGVKTNNFLSNLEICSYKENSQHAKRLGLINPAKGEDSSLSILSECDVLNIYKMLANDIPMREISAKYEVSIGTIGNIKSGRRWKHLFNKVKPKFSFKKLPQKTNLSESDLKEIKRLLKRGISRKEIALSYNVGVGTINYFIFYRKPSAKKTIKDMIKSLPPIESEKWSNKNKLEIFVSTGGRCLTKYGKLVKTKNGSYSTILHEGKTRLVHRLIWETFKGRIKIGFVINHKNGVKSDNRLENLEMVTFSENSKHAARTGLRKPCIGEQNKLSKLKEADVIQIYNSLKLKQMSSAEICRKYNISQSCVSLIKCRKAWKHIPIDKDGLLSYTR